MNLNTFNPVFNPPTAEDLGALDEALEDQYSYHAWDEQQRLAGQAVRLFLQQAAKCIITNVPASADRSAALRKLREARMDANSAITHKGKY